VNGRKYRKTKNLKQNNKGIYSNMKERNRYTEKPRKINGEKMKKEDVSIGKNVKLSLCLIN
jgi:hypothetical protein